MSDKFNTPFEDKNEKQEAQYFHIVFSPLHSQIKAFPARPNK